MAERTAPRVTRMLSLITYLERHGEATLAALALQFGVTEAQIKRDIEMLWVSGVPGHGPQDLIDFDPWAFDEGIIRLTNSQGVGQVRLSPREAVALIGALSAAVSGGAAPDAAHSALTKLRDAVGDGDAVRSVSRLIVDLHVVSTLRDAIETAMVVELDYVDANDKRSTRVIEPHRLVVIDGATYVECFCRRAQDYRTLKLDRISSATGGTEPIRTVPSESGGFSLVPQFQAVVTAQRPARWLLESFPDTEVVDDGATVTARFGVADSQAIAARLLAIGPLLQSVAPVQLANEVALQARAVLAAQA